MGVGGASKTRAKGSLHIPGKVLFSEGERKMERLAELSFPLIHTHETSTHTGYERTQSGFPTSREEVHAREERAHAEHAPKSPL